MGSVRVRRGQAWRSWSVKEWLGAARKARSGGYGGVRHGRFQVGQATVGKVWARHDRVRTGGHGKVTQGLAAPVPAWHGGHGGERPGCERTVLPGFGVASLGGAVGVSLRVE